MYSNTHTHTHTHQTKEKEKEKEVKDNGVQWLQLPQTILQKSKYEINL
jgi:hypothetical protein